MKTVLDQSSREEIINRISTLQDNSRALWGRMTVHQMLTHCTKAEEMFQGKIKFKRSFIGRLFGKMALKGFLKDEKPMKKNSPTLMELRKLENCDLASEKKKWISLIEEHAHYSNPDFVHPFFGKMTREEVGYFDYKHTDHHLRQFNS